MLKVSHTDNMSKIIPIKINNVLGGISPTEYLYQEGQYFEGLAIDPEFPISDNAVRPSGVIRPVAYEKFSSTNINATPIAILTNPKNSLVYALLSNGRIVSYTSALASETLVSSALGVCTGGAYYNDYIYMADTVDINRYGLLSGTPSLTTGVWTGATLGTQTALTNNTYPSLRNSGNYPQHVMFPHIDGKLYVLDYKSSVGYVHYIKTTAAGVNDGSTYNALDLPNGFMPMSGCSLGNDVVIAAIQTTSSVLNQGKSCLFFWDTVDTSFYRSIPVDGIVTAVHNCNGFLYVWAGSISGSGGHTLYLYLGGDTLKPVRTISEGFPPSHYAVSSVGSKISWGSFITRPENACVVHSYGTKDGTLPNSLHCSARATTVANSTDGQVVALSNAVQGAFSKPQVIIGSKNANTSEYTLDKLSTTYQTSYWRSEVFNLNTKFDIKKIEIPLGTAVASNITITPKIWLDGESSSKTLKVINSTNYPNSEKNITIYPTGCQGNNNFYLELKFSGTVLCPVLLPIQIELEAVE